jgi:hypothetical protein
LPHKTDGQKGWVYSEYDKYSILTGAAVTATTKLLNILREQEQFKQQFNTYFELS